MLPKLFVHCWPDTDGYIEELRFDYTLSENVHLWIVHKEGQGTVRIYIVTRGQELEISASEWEDLLHHINSIRRLFLTACSIYAEVNITGYSIRKTNEGYIRFTSNTSEKVFVLNQEEFDMLVQTKDNANTWLMEDFIRPDRL